MLAAVALLAAGCGSSSHGTVSTVTITTNPHSAGRRADDGHGVPRSTRGCSTRSSSGCRRRRPWPGRPSACWGSPPRSRSRTAPRRSSSPRRRRTRSPRSSTRSRNFPTVQRVNVAGRSGLTRDDFAAYLPPIFVESPVTGAHVHTDVPGHRHRERVRSDARRAARPQRQGALEADGDRFGGRAGPRHLHGDLHHLAGRGRRHCVCAVCRGWDTPARGRGPGHGRRLDCPKAVATMPAAERSPVAQLAEHPAVNRRVVGSSPTRGALSTCRGERAGSPRPRESRRHRRREPRIRPTAKDCWSPA